MKTIKLVALFATFIIFTNLRAQGMLDLSKYSDNTIMGTARYMGMAGSFGALGGDPSAIVDNPAAIGIYRSSELTFTLSPTITQAYTTSPTSQTKEGDFYFNFSNLSFIFSIPTYRDKGLVSANLSFSYNRIKDFHRTFGYRNFNSTTSLASSMARMTDGFYPSAISTDNVNVPYVSDLAYNGYLINPGLGADSAMWSPIAEKNAASSFYGVESGRIEEYNFAYGMNFSHKIYVGISLGVQSLYYNMYSENSEKYNDSQSMSLDNHFSSVGLGVNFGAGVIYRANKFLRLAASIHTPTYYSMVDRYDATLRTTNTFPDEPNYSYSSPYSSASYSTSSPLRFMASAGFVIGKRAIINVEYQLVNYSGMRFKTTYEGGDYLNNSFDYSLENGEIKKFAKISHTVKVGAEYRVATQFSLRAGFAYVSPAVSENSVRSMLDNTTRTDLHYYYDKGSYYGSIGLGYRYNGFGVDLAYLLRYKTDGFSTYQADAELGGGYFKVADNAPLKQRSITDIVTMKHNIALTLSYKF